MSRFIAWRTDDPEIHVAYGLDHALGWFCDEFAQDGSCTNEESTLFTGLSRSGLLEILQETNAPEEHLLRIALDLDPAS